MLLYCHLKTAYIAIEDHFKTAWSLLRVRLKSAWCQNILLQVEEIRCFYNSGLPNFKSNSNFKSHILTNAVGENIPNSFILDNDKNLKSQYIHIKCIISLRADNRQIALQETFLSQECFLQCKVPLVDEVL